MWRRVTAMVLLVLVVLVWQPCALTQADETRRVYLPVVMRPESKAGVAFSSHVYMEERVRLMGGDVAYWRGWQRSGLAQDLWGLQGTQSVWCDFYFHPYHSRGQLRPQLGALEKLPPDFDDYLLFLNEPDLVFYGHPPQCAAAPRRAAQIYVHVKTVLPQARLVGPGISHIDYVNGFEWLGAWWDEVVRLTGESPQMAVWDMHHYIAYGDPLAPFDALEAWLEERGVENPRFFVSEYGACDGERLVEMRDAFERDPRIVRYYLYEQYGAWWDTGACIVLFEERHGHMRLNEMGRVFVGLPAERERERLVD